jgi:hypothetical protein
MRNKVKAPVVAAMSLAAPELFQMATPYSDGRRFSSAGLLGLVEHFDDHFRLLVAVGVVDHRRL